MLLFIAFIGIAILFIQYASLRRRMEEAEDQIRGLARLGDQHVVPPPVPVPVGPPPMPAPARGPVATDTVRDVPIDVPALTDGARQAGRQEVPQEARQEIPPPLPRAIPVPPPIPMLEPRSSRDWEALIGGNLLNKAGALLLVIGIALFLSYSFAHMGPLGRSLTGVAVSVSLLVSGWWVERKETYRVFARGLLASGWAGLYFTAYAMHAMDAARVIDSPVLSAGLLLAVGAGMVLHSLRYRSQALTALAYGCAFAALALTELTTFAAIALVPLAVSLLYLARRFSWHEMALFGAVATYATFASHPVSGASLAAIQGMLAIFWVLFESFDLLRIREGKPSTWVHDAQFAINAVGGLGISAVVWNRMLPDSMWGFCAGAALAYLGSTIVRILLGEKTRYEAALTITTLMAGLAIFAHVEGLWRSVWWLVEIEALYLAGVFLRLPFARGLAAIAFVGPVAQLTQVSGTTRVLGAEVDNWAPSLGAQALLFYFNRYLSRPKPYYGIAATVFTAVLLAFQLPATHVAGALLMFGVVLMEVGVARRLFDFRVQGYAMGALATGAVGLAYLPYGHGTHLWTFVAGTLIAAAYAIRGSRWLPQLGEMERHLLRAAASAATVFYGAFWIGRGLDDKYWAIAMLAASVILAELGIRKLPREFLGAAAAMNFLGLAALAFIGMFSVQKAPAANVILSWGGAAAIYYWLALRSHMQRTDVGRVAGAVATALGTWTACLTIWMTIADPFVLPIYALMAVVFVELGGRVGIPVVRWHGRGLAVSSTVFFFVQYARGVEFQYLASGLVLCALHWVLWVRSRKELLSAVHGWIAAGLAAVLISMRIPQYELAAWTVLGVGLAGAGRVLQQRQLGYQALCLAAGIFGFAATGGDPVWQKAAVVGFYLAALAMESREGFGTVIRRGYSVGASVLGALILWHEASGGMLTLSWGAEGMALLGLGFLLRERMLRLGGLAVLMGCIGKLFAYDLRNLETMYRILSFIGLGGILLGVSWVYTRFREQVQRFL